MKSILSSTGAALLIGLATVTSAVSAEKGGVGVSHGAGGGAAMSRSAGGGGGGAMPHGAMGAGNSAGAARGGNASAFNGGNNMSPRGDSRMGRMDQDRGHERGRDHDRGFRGPGFAFGYYPDYGYDDDYSYDAGCYQPRQVHTRHGWRWRRVWVCN